VKKTTDRKFWLLKSEPSEFGIDDLEVAKKQTTAWTGVRNYQVRNFFRDDFSVGDLGFFYHSSCPEPGIYGLVEITSAAYPDPTQFDPKSDYYDARSPSDNPRWLALDVKLVSKLDSPLLLDKMREISALAGMVVLSKGNRLSVTPVDKGHWSKILELTGSASDHLG
jgi:predicted RNA-binding protein with PUA-like domain